MPKKGTAKNVKEVAKKASGSKKAEQEETSPKSKSRQPEREGPSKSRTNNCKFYVDQIHSDTVCKDDDEGELQVCKSACLTFDIERRASARQIHTLALTLTCTHIRTYASMHAHVCKHTHTYPCNNAHTPCTHTNTQKQICERKHTNANTITQPTYTHSESAYTTLSPYIHYCTQPPHTLI